MSNSTEQKVKRIVAEMLGLSVSDISNTSSIVGDLCVDSLDVVELVMCIEDEFDREIDDSDAERCRTVQDIIDYLNREILVVPADVHGKNY